MVLALRPAIGPGAIVLSLIPAADEADMFRPGRKAFFFEKKQQETVAYWHPRQPQAEAP